LDGLLRLSGDIQEGQVSYMLKKIVKRGVVFEKRGMLKYYEYQLAKQEGASPQELQLILSALASGDSSRLYVLEARYLLGQLYHSAALRNKSQLSALEYRKVTGEYNRAVKSELLGKLIYEVEQYRLTGVLDLVLADTDMGQDLLTYVFLLAIITFVLYYLRSKRFDQFHRTELEKQLRRAQEEEQERN
jgi:hypothetical protein